ncbi:YdcF family protein [Thermodesulfovibrionales bacterium]|nr:YdcF family protein [Thermodesulfovibrionales bacterium]
MPLERQYQQISEKELDRADKIVLLLGGEETNVLRVSEVLRLYFLKKGDIQIIISGKDPIDPENKEAEQVKEYLTKRGVLLENIILENRSRNTFESAKNIKKLIGKEPFFLVTSGYHLPRSMETFKQRGTLPIPAPTDFRIEKRYDIFDFFPCPRNLRNSNLGIREYFAILFYRLILF